MQTATVLLTWERSASSVSVCAKAWAAKARGKAAPVACVVAEVRVAPADPVATAAKDFAVRLEATVATTVAAGFVGPRAVKAARRVVHPAARKVALLVVRRADLLAARAVKVVPVVAWACAAARAET